MSVQTALSRTGRKTCGLRVLTTADSVWDTYISAAPHDFFHTRRYHRVWENGGVRANLAVYGDSQRFVAWPYLLRSVESKLVRNVYDVTCVYGYAGPIASGCRAGEPFIGEAWRAFLNLWRTENVVSVFSTFHPILDNQDWSCKDASVDVTCVGGLCAQGHTVGVALFRSEEEIWRNYEKKLRQKLRKCGRLGFRTVDDPNWEHIDEFVRVYHETMERRNAFPFYFFPKRHFEDLHAALGSNGKLLITKLNGSVAAAGLIIQYNGLAHLYLSGSGDRYAHEAPSKLLTHDAIIVSRTDGNYYFHMGGGRGNAKDSLFTFKASFSPDRLNFFTGRWILDQPSYATLTEEHRHSTPAGLQVAPDYFPAYRAPFIERSGS